MTPGVSEEEAGGTGITEAWEATGTSTATVADGVVDEEVDGEDGEEEEDEDEGKPIMALSTRRRSTSCSFSSRVLVSSSFS